MEEYKFEAQKQWNKTPCGTGSLGGRPEDPDLAFFDTVKYTRYEIEDAWMNKTIDFKIGRNKKVLEIGYGMGTDLLSWAQQGAEVHGIDITQTHYELATKNFELHGLKCNLKVCDSSAIDFPSNSFDIVYSLGVLHHTPDTVRCISEAYRVLKPGGRLILGMYRKYSAFHIFQMLLWNGILKGKLKKLGYLGLMSTLELGADGIKIKPLVKTYTTSQLKAILSDFSNVQFKVTHFKREHMPVIGRLIPRFVEPWFEKSLGWYIVAFATK